jgi:hypothetical protein
MTETAYDPNDPDSPEVRAWINEQCRLEEAQAMTELLSLVTEIVVRIKSLPPLVPMSPFKEALEAALGTISHRAPSHLRWNSSMSIEALDEFRTRAHQWSITQAQTAARVTFQQVLDEMNGVENARA